MDKHVAKKAGFKHYDSNFWVNERGKYGCRYQCKHCGKITLGMGMADRMHFSQCEVLMAESKRTGCMPGMVRETPETAPGAPAWPSFTKKRYRVTGEMTISVIVDVEASSEQEARDLAADQSIMNLCNQCASPSPVGQWSTTGDLDGEVLVLSARPLP